MKADALEGEVRLIGSLWGGKDSAALAIYMHGRNPETGYIFADTGKELPERYAHLDKISDYLGTPVVLPNANLGFDDWHKAYGSTVFTWSQSESLSELERPERVAQIKREAEKKALETVSANNLKFPFPGRGEGDSGRRTWLPDLPALSAGKPSAL